VQQCLLTTYHSWERLYWLGNAEAYTRTSMMRLAIKWRRRRWRGEVPTDPMPEAYISDHAGGVALAEHVRRALARLPAAQRAVLVLRFSTMDRTRPDLPRGGALAGLWVYGPAQPRPFRLAVGSVGPARGNGWRMARWTT
jgi:hypothetical protein